MALPIWGIFMKKCYANENLGVSKESFKRPSNLSIETNCDVWKENNVPLDDNLPDEFDF